MADYIKALMEGLSAAEAAEFARREIDEVFADLDRQVREATKGKISIERREFKGSPLGAGLGALLGLRIRPEPKYWAIAARNLELSEGSIKELADWSVDPAGYPCKLVWGGVERFCEDRESLENTLAELLRDPGVAEVLNSLMKLERKTVTVK